jgi:hypothetical protein
MSSRNQGLRAGGRVASVADENLIQIKVTGTCSSFAFWPQLPGIM